MGDGATAMLRYHAAHMGPPPKRKPSFPRVFCILCRKGCNTVRGFDDHWKRKHATQQERPNE